MDKISLYFIWKFWKEILKYAYILYQFHPKKVKKSVISVKTPFYCCRPRFSLIFVRLRQGRVSMGEGGEAHLLLVAPIFSGLFHNVRLVAFVASQPEIQNQPRYSKKLGYTKVFLIIFVHNFKKIFRRLGCIQFTLYVCITYDKKCIFIALVFGISGSNATKATHQT